MEAELGLDRDHVIVDRDAFDAVMVLLGATHAQLMRHQAVPVPSPQDFDNAV